VDPDKAACGAGGGGGEHRQNLQKIQLTFTVLNPKCCALPQVDPDKAFAVQVVLEESVVNSRISYVQCALLYTNSNGERRIRSALVLLPVKAQVL
jgi:protein transport protein SEC24